MLALDRRFPALVLDDPARRAQALSGRHAVSSLASCAGVAALAPLVERDDGLAQALFDFATARECLIRMLTDPNPLHRMSALWVVSQLQVLEIVRQVSATSRRDTNMRVRRRAADMLETVTGDPGSVITHEQGPI